MVVKKVVDKKDSYEDRLHIIEGGVREILEMIDEPEREGIKETPTRVARMWMDEIYHRGNPLEDELNKVFMEVSEAREMIIVRDIELRSWCEHHCLPWFGVAHVGYIPNGGIIGLSKIARLVQAAGTGLTIQERVTENIANALDKKMKPFGVIVVISAVHTCMVARGVKASKDCRTLTSAIRGVFRDSEATRSEFFSMIQGVK
jgi:GTP cyclohydrolase I